MQILYCDSHIMTQAAGNGYYNAISLADCLQTPWLLHLQRFLYQFSLCNLGMCLFNLLPFPPLDGFHVVNDILLRGRLRLSAQAFRISMLALLVLMNATSFFSNFLSSAICAVQGCTVQTLLRLFHLS